VKAKNLFVFILMLTTLLSFAGDISPKKIIDKVEETLSAAGNIRVHFTETFLWKLTGEKQSLSGELIMDNNDRFHITTEDQIIVSDGKTLWTYSKPSNRVLIDKLNTGDDALLPRRIFFHYTKDYDVRLSKEEEIEKTVCYLLEFDAQPGETFFPRVRVWIDKKTWIPKKIEQIDLNGNKTIFSLNEVKLEKTEPNDIFKFTIPKDVEVIRMQ